MSAVPTPSASLRASGSSPGVSLRPSALSPIQPDLDWSVIRDHATAFIATEYASLDRNGAPINWPVTPYLGQDGRTLDVSTGLTYPLKAERARRNPKVALAFSHPLGSGLDHPAAFVVQGLATVRDADLRTNAARFLEVSNARFPQTYASIPGPILRGMAFYWSRIWIEVTPMRVLWWSGADLNRAPQIWEPNTAPSAPPSDPAPTGRGAGSWKTGDPVDWRDPRRHRATGLAGTHHHGRRMAVTVAGPRRRTHCRRIQ